MFIQVERSSDRAMGNIGHFFVGKTPFKRPQYIVLYIRPSCRIGRNCQTQKRVQAQLACAMGNRELEPLFYQLCH